MELLTRMMELQEAHGTVTDERGQAVVGARCTPFSHRTVISTMEGDFESLELLRDKSCPTTAGGAYELRGL